MREDAVLKAVQAVLPSFQIEHLEPRYAGDDVRASIMRNPHMPSHGVVSITVWTRNKLRLVGASTGFPGVPSFGRYAHDSIDWRAGLPLEQRVRLAIAEVVNVTATKHPPSAAVFASVPDTAVLLRPATLDAEDINCPQRKCPLKGEEE